MFFTSMLASASNRLRTVFGHINKCATRATGLFARQQDRSRVWQHFEIGLMLFVTMLTKALCLRTYEYTVHARRIHPRNIDPVFKPLFEFESKKNLQFYLS